LSRVFAYGCSFTKYYYPTWADIIIRESQEGYNCGKLGSGNQLIANRIWETNAIKKFNKDDTIIIMWSNFFREDRYNGEWVTRGNIFNQNIEHDDLEYYVYRDCNLIASTLLALKTTGANVISTSINNPYTDDILLEHETISKILDMYKQWVEPKTKTLTELSWYPNIEKDKTRPQYLRDNEWYIEDHPLPLEHCNFVENVLHYKITDSTKEFINDWQIKLHTMESKEYDRIFESSKTIEWVI